MEDKILIPQGTNVEITNDLIKVKGKYGEIEKKFDPYDLQINTNEKEVIISTKTDKKKRKEIAKHLLFSHKQHDKGGK